ncbi:LacI family transcriptional regulator [Chelatococcus asaccharovorans]|nr:LacI family transcriptional regulator [Chelatococcus asaccharovorans]CAH1690965.1 LacI family transcriptional regulator [Chelatococcus asaccharovorans]
MQASVTQRKNQNDLAKALGVSVSTISRALSDAPGISEDLRERVRRLAREMGYEARGGKGGSSRHVHAYVTLDRTTDGLTGFYDGIVKWMIAEARVSSMTIEVRLADDRTEDIRRIADDVARQRVEAVFLVGIDPPAELAQLLLERKVPTVLVNGADPDMRFDCVTPSNFYGAQMAAQILMQQGHRSLLYVSGHLRWTTLQRLRGFKTAVADRPEAQLSVVTLAAPTRDQVERVVDALQDGRAPTAIFCINDLYAVSVMQALHARGYDVPGDVSVLGFDDLPFAEHVTPRLSTFRVARRDIGRQSVQLMARRLADPEAVRLQVEVGVVPVTGQTVAAIGPVA